MSRDLPALLDFWAARLADGQEIDWVEARKAMPDDLVTRLASLERLAATMRASDAGPETPSAAGNWGHLRLLESLGRGGFGEVFRAFDPILQREVALKLRHADSEDPDPRRWIREARQLARVRHPNVLAVHGADIHDGVPGLWADRVEGRTLRERIAEAVPDSDERLEIAIQLAEAVRAVHAEGLVHGDIKPANVIIEEPQGRAILMDFGTARDVVDAPVAIESTGTPLFMAPERLSGRPASTAADVFALGATLASLATGRPAFRADSVGELQALHARGDRPRLEVHGIPRAYRRLVESMLAADPAARPSIDSVIARLERLRAAPARRRRLAAVSTIIVLLTAGLAIALTAYVRVRDAEDETAAVNSVLRDVLAAPRGTEQGRNVRVVDVLDRAVPEAERRFGDDQPLALARVRALVGRTWESLGLDERAEALLDQAHAEFARRFGPDDPRTVELLDPMARVQDHLGRLGRAESLWREMVERSGRKSPENRANAIAGRTGLAAMLFRDNRLDEAEALLEEAFAFAGDPATARSEVNARMLLALVQMRGGRFDAAEANAGQALDLSLAVNGERHVNTLIARDRLIELYTRRGNLEAAEPLARRNLETTLSWLGENEVRTIMAQNALSNILHDRGRMDEALALLEDAIRGAQQTLPADAPQRLTLEANRVARYLEMGRPADAVVHARQVERLLEASGRPVNQLPWVNRLNLADGLLQTGRAEDSLREAARAHQAIVDQLGEAHPLAWIAASYEGNALNAVGRAEDAAALLEPALAHMTERLGATHTQTLIAAGWRAGNLAALGRIDEALELATETRVATVEQVGADHVRVARLDGLIERLRNPQPPDPI